MFLLSARLVVGLLLSSNIGLAMRHGPGSSGRFDILHGTGGQNACTLGRDVVLKCTPSSTRRDFLLSPNHNRDDDITIVPSNCTCNAIFFNIWSACSYLTGNNTLPNFSQWKQVCMTSFIDVDSSTRFSEMQRNLGIDVPSWAKMRVPGNSTFDMQRAVKIAFTGQWSILQMILPIVLPIVAAVVTAIVLLTYQRYRQHKLPRGSGRSIGSMGWPKGLKRLHFHTSHKVVTTIDRDEEWEIDGPPRANQPRFINLAPSSDDALVRSFPYDMEMTDIHDHDKKSKTVSSLKSATEKVPMHLPWKRRPPHITLVPATSRFRVDDAESILTSSGEAVGRNEINVQVAREQAEDIDRVPPEIDETRSLITSEPADSERDSQEVILISKDGGDFTLESTSQKTMSINSHIKIISPSVSSTSPHSAMHSVPAKPNLYPPSISPPPPSHAASASPVIPQSLRPATECRSEKNREQSLTYFQQQPFLSPIKEASSQEQSFTSSNIDLYRSPALRRLSNPESFSSLYMSPEESSYSVVTTPLPSSDLHQTTSSSPGPDLSSRAFGSEDEDFYMQNTTTTTTITNGPEQYYGHPTTDSDLASFPSFYYNYSPAIQTPTPHSQGHHPAKLISYLTGPSAFYAGPVRGAEYYSVDTDTQ